LAFATHVLLDCLTVYGTQAFWPLPTPPIMWSTVFIIDPVYSAPLFFGVLAAMLLSRQSPRGHALNTLCLAITTFYLIWSVGAKVYVSKAAHESLQRQNLPYSKLLAVPAPFNTVLWRILAINDHGYYEGFYSLLDDTNRMQFKGFSTQTHLLRDIADHWPVKRLQWFTQGFYSVERLGDHAVITDLRMGLEPSYVFRFKVGEFDGSNIRPVKSQRVFSEQRWEQLGWVWHRIWSDRAERESPSIRSKGV
jgi:inner membrane protein